MSRLVRRGFIGHTVPAMKPGDRMSYPIAARTIVLLATLAAAGCNREVGGNASGNAQNASSNNAAANVVASAPASTLPVQVYSQGIRVGEGDGREFRFGSAQADVVAALAPIGRPPVETNAECGAGPLQIGQWPNGLSLLFQEGRLVGWSVAAAAGNPVRTPEGIGTGATRARLAAAYPRVAVDESTLGTEFEAGGIGGLLESEADDARVAALWAGTTCHFR
jgi:hypothetical protein